MRRHGTTGGVLLAGFLLLGFASMARAEDRRRGGPPPDRGNNYNVTILVSNEAEDAPVVDPLLKNGWGIAASGSGPWWVADNGTGYSTVYNGDGEKLSLEVQVPGAPTGTVFNGGTQFQVADGAPAVFLFASEDGTFSAWNPTVDPNAQVVFTSAGSIYKGMAIHGDTLYATDFGLCKVGAYQGNFFDNSFAQVDTAGGFADGSIPASYCPFGIQAVGDSIFVTYAKKDGEDDSPGKGHGFVREFDTDGNLTAKVGSRGQLNSPWGIAMAPAGFRKVRRLPARRQFRRRQDQRLLREPRRQLAFRRPPASPLARDRDRRTMGHRIRKRRSGRPGERSVLRRRARRRGERVLRKDRGRREVTRGPLSRPGSLLFEPGEGSRT